jgi:hypothetical protein
VLGIGTSIERFFDFYVHVVCRQKEIEPEDTLKGISHPSERLRGAFTFA